MKERYAYIQHPHRGMPPVKVWVPSPQMVAMAAITMKAMITKNKYGKKERDQDELRLLNIQSLMG